MSPLPPVLGVLCALIAFPARALAGPGDEPPAEQPDQDAIVTGPRVLSAPDPVYPPEMLDSGVQAAVTVAITLDAQGQVTATEILRSGGEAFDQAALDAIAATTFAPAATAEGPVGVMFEYTLRFELTEQTVTRPAAVPPVTGRVRQLGTGIPLDDVNIQVLQTDVAITTDASGRFTMPALPPGTWTLEIFHYEHEPVRQEVTVEAGSTAELDIWLRYLEQPDNVAVAYYERPRVEVTQRSVSIDEVKKIPGTFGDPVKVIQTLPGAARSPFGTGFLIIRGSNPEDSAVYIDGVRVPIIYHLTGTTSVLSPDLISGVDYLPGGYGVQFGRTMGGAIDVRTKSRFDDHKIVFGADILDAQVYYEGNLGRNKQHGFAAAARRSYIDVFIPAFTAEQDFTIQPIYWDYQTKWVPDLGEGHELSVFAYGFQDILRFSSPDDVPQGTDPAAQGNLSTKYQSHRLMLRWSREFSDTLRFDLRPSFGWDRVFTGLGSDISIDSRTWLFQTRAEVSWQPHPIVEVMPGLDFLGGPYSFATRLPFTLSQAGDPLAERDPVSIAGQGTAWSPAPYLNLRLRPLPDPDAWIINAGLRWDYAIYFQEGSVNFGEKVDPAIISSFDPRVSTRLRVFGDEERNGTFKAATGLYHQPPQPFESIGVGTTNTVGAERAWNSSVGFEHRVSPAFSWDLELFYRDMDDLIIGADPEAAGDDFFVNAGEGFAAGAELILRHEPIGPFFGWVSYTFSRSFRRDGPGDDWTPFDFDQPHIFSAQGAYSLPRDWTVSAQLQVVSGNPATPYDFGIYDADADFYTPFALGEPNSVRLPPFVQTSFRVDKTWTFKRWQLEAYVDLINAIRGVNPELTVYTNDYTEYAYVRGLPFIPNIGLEVRVFP